MKPVWQWETRQQWGARPPRSRRTDVTPAGVVIHWPGPGSYAGQPHDQCRAVMRAWQAMHMARGSNDLEYGLVLCPHLRLMEARIERDRPNVRVGSNGTAAANERYSSVQLMRGTGDGPPTDDEVLGLAQAVAWLRENGGWSPQISGHRDHVSTSCPGDRLYGRLDEIEALVRKVENEPDDPPDPRPGVSLRRLRRLARRAEWSRGYGGRNQEQVTMVTDALAAEGMGSYRKWQQHLGYTGGDADGVPGEASLTKLGDAHGFKVCP